MPDEPPPSPTPSPPDPPQTSRPHIPASTRLPEITLQAVLLGAALSIILGAANVYLGLKAGMTVAASIPAAVISMAVLRLFKRSNILENNIVQTAASAGESLAAGVIFTIPALLLMGVWPHFHYWQTTVIAALGGTIGVLFTVPLRRALVVEADLPFPEGLATAEVLKVGDRAAEARCDGVGRLIIGAVIGAGFKFGESGLRLWTATAETAAQLGSAVAYIGINLAPALVGVGYIVGLNIAILMFLGGALNWFIAIPVIAAVQGLPEAGSPAEAASAIWSAQTRYIGVGAMVIGGLWALLRMSGHLRRGVRSGLDAYRAIRMHGHAHIDRTDRDTPLPWIAALLLLAVIPLFFVFLHITAHAAIAGLMAVMMLIAGFLFAAVASYMAGLVGSSNNPISGVTIATILTAALLLLALGVDPQRGPTAAILIGAVVCCAAAIGGDNMQDLKAGAILGATPFKQQAMQIIGVLTAAFFIAPVLTLLLRAYGIGDITVEDQQPLAAPQAVLMASVARGVFERNLPWGMVLIGMVIAAIVIAADLILERRRAAFRMPVLAVAIGLYLPLELATAVLTGGLVAFAADRYHLRSQSRRAAAAGADDRAQAPLTRARRAAQRNGLLFAAGLITGEALAGILLAIPLVLLEGRNPFDLRLTPTRWPGLLLLMLVLLLLYRIATRRAATIQR